MMKTGITGDLRYSPSILLLVILNLVFILSSIYPAPRSITVAGFRNIGGGTDSQAGLVLTRSLISQLSRLSDVRITSFEDISRYAAGRSLWPNLDRESALSAALYFNTSRVLYGTYTHITKSNLVLVDVYSYDTATGSLLLKRSFSGKAGESLLETVDSISGSVIGLIAGQDNTYVSLTIGISNSTNDYRADVNARPAAFFIKDRQQTVYFPVNEPFELSLYRLDTGREIFRRRMAITNTEGLQLTYIPSGSLVIKNNGLPADVYLNGLKTASLSASEPSHIISVNSGATNALIIRHNDNLVLERNIIMGEGETEFISFQAAPGAVKSGPDYSSTSPGFNWLVPGYAQYQAGEWAWGLGYSITGYGGLGTAALFGILGSMLYSKASAYTDTENRDRVSGLAGQAMAVCAAGAGVWLLSAGLSWFHADSLKRSPAGNGLKFSVSRETFSLNMDVKF